MGAAHLEEIPDTKRTVARGGKTFAMNTAGIGRGRKAIAPPDMADDLSARQTAHQTAVQAADQDDQAGEVAGSASETVLLLAKSVLDIRASPEEIVASCAGEPEQGQLHKACQGAAACLEDIADACRARPPGEVVATERAEEPA